ncbi:hypothetical protein AB833_16825 [Chromatiales bacterium (ex Bugula neritina AB1)]|nr:hypothetical protein AB833_16825 [Chromatiales bacterium (ex Bugula neritina AB1)]
MRIDRADYLRRDEKSVQALWNDPSSVVIPVYQTGNLIDLNRNTAVFKTQGELQATDLEHVSGTFLGLDKGTAYFAVNCTEQQAERWCELSKVTEFSDLRTCGPLLPGHEASILAYSRGIIYWQQQNPYCSLCGTANRLVSSGHMMSCSSPLCSSQTFPRTDPAVIMLVERTGDDGQRYCLLGRSPQWPDKVFSTLAGFVEVGETLEAAVIREVHEEAGVVVINPRYMASQPWPFPQSIMLGFIATAATSEITLDETEVAEARWFSDKEISTFGNWGDDGDNPKLPRKDSIARYLIDNWCERRNLPV